MPNNINSSRDIRVVLDTNTLVSAAISNGKPYQVLKLIEENEVISITSLSIAKELEDVLKRDKIPFNNREVELFVGKFLHLSKVVNPSSNLEIIEEDPDDDKIIQCGLEGKVDYIISGDSHLLNLEEYGSIEIIDSSGFLNQIKQ